MLTPANGLILMKKAKEFVKNVILIVDIAQTKTIALNVKMAMFCLKKNATSPKRNVRKAITYKVDCAKNVIMDGKDVMDAL